MTPFRAWLVLAMLVFGGGREDGSGLDLGLGLRCVSAKEHISNLCKYKAEAGDGDEQQSQWKCSGIASSRDLKNALRFDVQLQDVKQCIRMSTMQGPIGCGGGCRGVLRCFLFFLVVVDSMVWYGISSLVRSLSGWLG